MALREIKPFAIPLTVKGVISDRCTGKSHRDDRLFQRGLMSVIRAALAEPGSTIAEDLRAIGVRLPDDYSDDAAPPNECSGLGVMAVLSGALIGSAITIAAGYFL